MASQLIENVRNLSMEAVAIHEHVSGQQQVCNVSIDRSIELYIVKNDMSQNEFDRLRLLYFRTQRHAQRLGIDVRRCVKCPDPS